MPKLLVVLLAVFGFAAMAQARQAGIVTHLSGILSVKRTDAGTPPPNGLHLDVADGSILVSNGGGQVQLNAGQFGFVGGPNVPPAAVPPQQGIPVTMPPAISQDNGSGQGIGKGKEGECSL